MGADRSEIYRRMMWSSDATNPDVIRICDAVNITIDFMHEAFDEGYQSSIEGDQEGKAEMT